jgi:phage terminase large subunit
MTELEIFKARLAGFAADPVDWVRVVFRVEPDEQQVAILRAYAKPGSHVSVRAGHGVGKSTVAAWVILHFLSFNPDCRVPCTAPSSHQLFDVLWAEVAKWHKRMHPWFKQQLVVKSDTICVRGDEKGRWAAARTARRECPDALQGFHGTNILFVIDEASGVDDEIFQVAEGALTTPGARCLLLGNPTRPKGFFYDTHTKDRAGWECFVLNCWDSKLPGVRDYAAKMRGKYGEASNIYKVRVLGEFPVSADDVLIPLDWVESAVGRDIKSEGARRVAGLDVARYGDDATALCVRRGGELTYLEEWRNIDLMRTVGNVVQLWRDKRLFDVVNVDVIGLGSGVYDRLREIGVPCVAVNVAESTSFKDSFVRLRDELWWKTREWFEKRECRIAPDIGCKDELISQLSGIKYEITSSGKTKVESKDMMKARGMASPNEGDALVLSMAEGCGGGSVVRAREVVVSDASGYT